ncbi:MAG: AAA family ATPase [Actinomycetia bacterium]|nr:AAA family ATPase [Actinomycetes bacterium]MCP4960749.1 AAA family ATPase [Actinomycetes bacterium]
MNHVPYATLAETHISVVSLVGDRAFKLLKPIQTSFLDHRSVEDRRRAINEELDLNRRLARDVYLGISDIVENGQVTDYMLVMRRMPSDRRLTVLLATTEADEALRSVAKAVAGFHASLEPNEIAAACAGPADEWTRWQNNIDELGDLVAAGVFDGSDVEQIQSMARCYIDGRHQLFEQRIAAGLARDGHGDLMADDIFVLTDGPRILDCLAFDQSLRQGDVLADIAFLVMDIERLAGPDAAARLLRYYQEFSAENHPASLAHHYVAYRALVRAKIWAIRYVQTRDPEHLSAARGHIAQCQAHLVRAQPRLTLVGGGPGSGKSTLAEAIGAAMGWTVLNTDEIRKDVSGRSRAEHAMAEPDEGIYTPENTELTYRELVDEASALLGRGESVVLDASWSLDTHREMARRVGGDAGAKIVELECHLTPTIAKERITRRLASPWTISDATPEIVDHMSKRRDDWPQAISIDTSRPKVDCRDVAVRHIVTESLEGTVA